MAPAVALGDWGESALLLRFSGGEAWGGEQMAVGMSALNAVEASAGVRWGLLSLELPLLTKGIYSPVLVSAARAC
jgi:hypothetical protein